MIRFHVCALLGVTALGFHVPVGAQEADPPAAEYHYPRGSWTVGGTFGVAFAEDRTVLLGGASVGYAALTGLVPNVRALVISDDGIGAEAALGVLFVPPLSFSLLPFALVEGGRRWVPGGAGWLYGAGGGLVFGRPDQTFVLQAGYVFRRIVFDGFTLDASGPLIALSIRFGG